MYIQTEETLKLVLTFICLWYGQCWGLVVLSGKSRLECSKRLINRLTFGHCEAINWQLCPAFLVKKTVHFSQSSKQAQLSADVDHLKYQPIGLSSCSLDTGIAIFKTLVDQGHCSDLCVGLIDVLPTCFVVCSIERWQLVQLSYWNVWCLWGVVSRQLTRWLTAQSDDR